MAKAVDPNIEKDAAFRLANEKCVKQEKRNLDEIQFGEWAFERLDTDVMESEDEVSFPELFSALKVCID